MTLLEYFQWAVNNKLHLQRKWCVQSFGIIPENIEVLEPYLLKLEDAGLFVDTGSGWVKITDYKRGQPLFDIDAELTLPAGFLGFVKNETKTTYGSLILNVLLFLTPYKGSVEYVNGKLTPSIVNGIGLKMLSRDRSTPDKHRIVMREHLEFEDMCSYITLFSRVTNISATPKMIEPPLATQALRDELLAKHKDNLKDPIVAADIQKQLANSLKEEFKDDPGMRFMYYDKIFDVALMRTDVMYGAEPDFLDETKINFVMPSLEEGFSPEHMQIAANSARGASHDRGKNTALGGAAVKDVTRITQNYNFDTADCGSKLGHYVLIHNWNVREYVGRYPVGRATPYTEDELKALVGKKIRIRSPGYCQAKLPSRCKVCFGDRATTASDKITGQSVNMYSKYMLAFMKNMHSTALKVEHFDYLTRIN